MRFFAIAPALLDSKKSPPSKFQKNRRPQAFARHSTTMSFSILCWNHSAPSLFGSFHSSPVSRSMMIRETAQSPLKNVPKANYIINMGCLSGAPRCSLVHPASRGLAHAHLIANLQAITTPQALYWEQINEC
jgi:hypothetical protein